MDHIVCVGIERIGDGQACFTVGVVAVGERVSVGEKSGGRGALAKTENSSGTVAL